MKNKSGLMLCSKCGSSNITFQVIPKKMKKSFWTSHYKAANATFALCNDCGHRWQHRETKEKIQLILKTSVIIVFSIIIIFLLWVGTSYNP